MIGLVKPTYTPPYAWALYAPTLPEDHPLVDAWASCIRLRTRPPVMILLGADLWPAEDFAYSGVPCMDPTRPLLSRMAVLPNPPRITPPKAAVSQLLAVCRRSPRYIPLIHARAEDVLPQVRRTLGAVAHMVVRLAPNYRTPGFSPATPETQNQTAVTAA